MISPRHANFIENAGGATTADALALMAEARRRAHEFGVELEHEVQLLGAVRAAAPAGRSRRWTAGRGEVRRRGRPSTPPVACPRGPSPAARRGARHAHASCRAGGSLLIGLALFPLAAGAFAAARETSLFAVDRSSSAARRPLSRARCDGAARR